MSLKFGSSTKQDNTYYPATVLQVIFLDVVLNGRIIYLKYSVKRRVKGVNDIVTRRYLRDNKFISIPKIGLYVYIWSNLLGYFWDKRLDKELKDNLGLDHLYGSTIINGTNNDIIIFNGTDLNSLIDIISRSTKNDNIRTIIFDGQRGNINTYVSNVFKCYRKNVRLASTLKIFISAGTNLVVLARKINVQGLDGIILKNDVDGKKVLPMVLGDKLILWQLSFMLLVSRFLGNYTTLVQTAVNATAGPGRAGARRVFKARADPIVSALFTQQKNDIKKKLSPKNKVD